MRKMASVQRIEEIKPIEGADAIEAYRVLGWWVVDKKSAHAVGDLVIYCEIDSWIPTELAAFLSKGKEPREYNGVRGERLRTVKLRGQISQGLLLKINVEDNWGYITGSKSDTHETYVVDIAPENLVEGYDATESMGIQKWEPVLAAQLQGKARGNFPTHLVPKTDQERIQNCFRDIERRGERSEPEKLYEVTIKLDGSSMTVFRWEDVLRVCSRNLELKTDDDNAENSFVSTALKIGDKIPDGLAFQGELMGPGIQGNRENFTELKFFVYSVYDIRKQEYLLPRERRELCESLGLPHVPLLQDIVWAPRSVEEGLALAEGPSINHPIREGLVWKSLHDSTFSFKTISNKFLLKGGE